MWLFSAPYDDILSLLWMWLSWIYFFSMPLCVVHRLKRQLRDENFSWKSIDIIIILAVLLFGGLGIAQLLFSGIINA